MGKEKDSAWYDEVFRTGGASKQYFRDPDSVPLYPIWSAILDEIDGNERIIDLGCGPGQFAQLAFGRNKKYVLGIDFSEEAIEMAKNRNPTHQEKFIVGDLFSPDVMQLIRDIDCEVVVMAEFLEHVEDDLTVLSSIHNKHMIISLPSYDSEGHVRCFKTEEEIRNRYSSNLEIKTITRFNLTPGNKTFVVDGYR